MWYNAENNAIGGEKGKRRTRRKISRCLTGVLLFLQNILRVSYQMMKNFIPVISTVVYESKANLFKQKYKSRYFPDSFVLIVYIGTLYSGTKSCYLLLF